MKKDNKIKIFIIILITVMLMGISSITIYSNICSPKFYDYFIDTGIKYLTDGKYEEAILAFNKAIKIDEKTTEARVYLAEGYIGNQEYDKAIYVLEEAQYLDIENEGLLKEILEILNGIDSDIAYEFLERFINIIGKDNISKDIEDMLDSAYEAPENPIVYPEPGIYIKPISIKLKLDEIKVGHSFYYTIDGSEPNKYSQRYRGKIDINKNTTIKLIGYNKNTESTEIITLDYKIDSNIIDEINNKVNESKELLNNTKIGTNVGETTEKAKNTFKLVIDKVSNLLKKDQLNYTDANNMKIEIVNAFEIFKDNIIKPTDKSKLQSAINKAQNLYNNSTEGSGLGQFKVGSKSDLLNSINEAKQINDSITSSQENIDEAKLALNNAINKFENNKIEEFNYKKALQYAINKYGPPVEPTRATSFFSRKYVSVSSLLYDEDDNTKKYEIYVKEEYKGEPIKLIRFSVDENGNIEPIITTNYKNNTTYYHLSGKLYNKV